MDIALLAAEITRFFFMKASEGAITKAGEGFLYKLKGIVQDLLQGKIKWKEAIENPEILEAEIIKDISEDRNKSIRQELESIVKELKTIETNRVNASQSNVHGNNQVIGSVNSENVVGGNQEIKNFFR